jgi:hypothetical protein
VSADRDGWLLAAPGREAAAEERELRALVDQAWELRGTPYLRDACEAIVDWHERRHLRRLEAEQERTAALRRLLRGGHRA